MEANWRFYLAQSEKCPIDLLLELAKDSDPTVRGAAAGKCTVKISSQNGSQKFRVKALKSKGSCLLTITAPAKGEYRRLIQKVAIRVS